MLTVGNITTILSASSVKVIVQNYDRRYEFLRSLRLLSFITGAVFAIFACNWFFISKRIFKCYSILLFLHNSNGMDRDVYCLG